MRIGSEQNQATDLTSLGQAEAQLAVRKKNGEQESAARQGGDVIDISEEGRQKSAAMQAADSNAPTAEASGEGTDNGSGDATTNAGDSANTAELEKKLQSKKTETKRKKEKLDTAKRQADGDSGNTSEVQKLKGEVDRLQREEKKLKSQVYSS